MGRFAGLCKDYLIREKNFISYTVNCGATSDPDQAKEISFQNITGARNRVQTLFCIDMAAPLDNDQWNFVVRCFQKRHLLAHTMGVIDNDYVKRANDPKAILGRKITIDADEVIELVKLLEIVGSHLYKNLST